MNIFVLDEDPVLAATMQCDKHVVKMVLESAQLLCSPFENGEAPYRRTHYNHPCSIWTRTSRQNYDWLLIHAYTLVREYNTRYNKTHKSLSVIDWCAANCGKLNLPDIGRTPFVQAMPDKYKNSCDAVAAYRAYYLGDKAKFAKWTGSNPPEWWNSCVSTNHN